MPNADARIAESATPTLEEVRGVVQRQWGFDSFRPLQLEAIEAVLAGRDSVVVLPTGGGKSLCFQAPACCLPGTAVVVSPLISLMKDQVDALSAIGVPAAQLNSTLSPEQRRQVIERLQAGELKLLYLAPEGLLTERGMALIDSIEPSLLAIDEAHCISSWGHDFRPEYRGLSVLKKRFPRAAVHAYTATATQRVQQDIVEQLGLSDPALLVGSYDRPNLVYLVKQRTAGLGQMLEVIDRHAGESGIVYCISRKDVEKTTAALKTLGHRAVAYHAGMDERQRHASQDAFLTEEADVIVATVAFGMGIDKSNVRYVIHAAAPKSLEAYQQESGRAGRDGMEAECCLFFSGGDFGKWRRMMQQSPGDDPGSTAALANLEQFCSTPRCRHQLLVEHFGQTLEQENCGACDVCLGHLDQVEEPLILAQKILSCVARLEQMYGADYTAQVLAGSQDQRILQKGHDQLSTYGLLAEDSKRTIRNWIEQLIGQGCAKRFGEYQQLQLTELGWQVLRGEHTPMLTQPTEPASTTSASRGADPASWEGVDRGLFQRLRELRREIAGQLQAPAYIVFGDATLRDLARRRPSEQAGFLAAHGVGEKKWNDYGERFLEAIGAYCDEAGLTRDVDPKADASATDGAPGRSTKPASSQGLNAAAAAAFPLFAAGVSIDDAAAQLGRARSTVCGYLEQYIRQEDATDPSPWVDETTARQVNRAIDQVGGARLKPIYEQLGGDVPYEVIRIVGACKANSER